MYIFWKLKLSLVVFWKKKSTNDAKTIDNGMDNEDRRERAKTDLNLDSTPLSESLAISLKESIESTEEVLLLALPTVTRENCCETLNIYFK